MDKLTKKLLIALIGCGLIASGALWFNLSGNQQSELDNFGATKVFPGQGGLGTSTVPTMGQIPIGNSIGLYSLNTLTAGSGITITNATNSITISAPSATFAWTPGSEGNSTSTRLIFGNGFISQASSTISNSLQLAGALFASSTISAERLAVGSGTSTFVGGIRVSNLDLSGTSATSTFANGLRISGGSLQLLLTGCNGTSVLETDSLGNLQCGADADSGSPFAWTPSSQGNSTSTRLLLGNGFISSASSTVASTLQISGAVFASSTLSADRLAINTGTSTFAGNILASNLQITGNVDLRGATVQLKVFSSFTLATSTTGTTSKYFLATAFPAQAWNFAECRSSNKIADVQFYNGSNRLNMIRASGTAAKFALNTNNVFALGSIIDIEASSSASFQLSCTLEKNINQ